MGKSVATFIVGVSATILVVTTSCLAQGWSNPRQYDFEVTADFEITPRYNSSFGRVNGARQCGGQGTFLEWRYTSCDDSKPGLCQVPAETFGRGYVSFIPRQSANSLTSRITVRESSNYKELVGLTEAVVKQSAVAGGKEYTISAGSVNGARSRGKTLTIRWTLFRPNDNVLELCVEVDYQVF